MERHDVSTDSMLAALVDAVERGDEVVIVRNGTPVAELRPLSATSAARSPTPITRAAFAGLAAVRDRVGSAGRVPSAAMLVRELRDLDEH